MRQGQTQSNNESTFLLFKKYVQYSLKNFYDYRLSLIYIIHPVSKVKAALVDSYPAVRRQTINISQTTKL